MGWGQKGAYGRHSGQKRLQVDLESGGVVRPPAGGAGGEGDEVAVHVAGLVHLPARQRVQVHLLAGPHTHSCPLFSSAVS